MFSLFKQVVESEPDNIVFILSNKEHVTYHKADQIVDLWAKYLVTIGIRQGDRLTLLTKHEDLNVFIHLALDKLNATIVLRDTETAPEQLKHIPFANTILIDPSMVSLYSELETPVIALQTSGIYPHHSIDLSTVCLPTIVRDKSIPNYIAASSGTTQTEKWMGLQEAGLLKWAKIEKKLLKLNKHDRILCTRSPAYDARISEYIRSFAAGSTLVLLSQQERRDLHEIVRQCELEKITCLILISSQLSTPDQDELICRLARAGLRHLMVTGDACTMSLKLTCEKYNVQLWNCYGPTEATFGMSILCVNNITWDQRSVPIGKPNSKKVRYHLIDGCLYIESPFLTSGYIKNEAQTKKNFPLITVDGRTFRAFNTENKFSESGDFLVYEGRINDRSHVKISGVKVSAEAITNCIQNYNLEVGKEVLAVHTVIKPWMNTNTLKPVAYLVLHHPIDKQHFSGYLNAWLRKEERPIIVTLTDLPTMAASTKIDERKLIGRTDQSTEVFSNESQGNIPNSSSMNRLQKIWGRVLGITPLNMDQDFMFSGGNSFQLNQLSLYIKQKIQPDFSYQDLLRLPSLTLRSIHHALTAGNQQTPVRALCKSLSEIKPGRDNSFWLPPLLGEGYFTYRAFVVNFSNFHDFNIYGLSDPGIHDLALVPGTIEEEAERYLQTIQDIQAHGPYNLLGFSYGSTLAWYVAKRLLELGEQVNTLQIIDGMPPNFYQKLPRKPHAILLGELANYIVRTLNTRYYGEQLECMDLSGLEHYSTRDQINQLMTAIESRLVNPQSRPLVAMARQHLLFVNTSPPPVKLPIRARLYLSNREQTRMTMIHYMPKKGRTPVETLLYHWSDFIGDISYSKERDAQTTHLGLLDRSNTTALDLKNYWDELSNGVDEHPIARLDFEPFYTLDREDEHSIRCKITGLRLADIALLQTVFPGQHESHPVFDYMITGEYRQGTERSTRYCHEFLVSGNDLAQLRPYLSEKNIREYSVNQAIMAGSSGTLFRETFHISLLIKWDEHPLAELSFTCHSQYFDLNALLQVTRALELTMVRETMSGYSLIRLEKNMPSTQHTSPKEATTTLLHRFILLLEPHINHKPMMPDLIPLLPQSIKLLKRQMPKSEQIQLAGTYFANWMKRTRAQATHLARIAPNRDEQHQKLQAILANPDESLMRFLSDHGGYLCVKSYEAFCQLGDYLQQNGHIINNPPCQFIDFAVALDKILSNKTQTRPQAIILDILLKILMNAMRTRGVWQEPMIELFTDLLTSTEVESTVKELMDWYDLFKNPSSAATRPSRPPKQAPKNIRPTPGSLSELEDAVKTRPIDSVTILGIFNPLKPHSHYGVKVLFKDDPAIDSRVVDAPYELPISYIVEHFNLHIDPFAFSYAQMHFPELINDDLIEKKRLMGEIRDVSKTTSFANKMDAILPREMIRKIELIRVRFGYTMIFYLHGQENGIHSHQLFVEADNVFSISGAFSQEDIASHYADFLDPDSFKNAIDTLYYAPHTSQSVEEDKTLNGCSQNMSASSVLAMAERLKTNTTVETLLLIDCNLDDASVTILIEAIESNPGRIKKLNLAGNKMGKKAALALARLLANPACSLTSLSIRGNAGTGDSLLPVLQAVRTNNHLIKLDCFSCGLDKDEYVQELVAIIEQNITLETLNLGSNNFQDYQGARLVEALAHNPSIQHLSLRHSGAGSAPSLAKLTAMALAKILQTNTVLESLNLWFHDVFKRDTPLPIVDALQQYNHSLKEIEGLNGEHERAIRLALKSDKADALLRPLASNHRFFQSTTEPELPDSEKKPLAPK